MAQRESSLSRTLIAELKGRGAFCFKVWGSEHMMAGLPDIIGCYKGKFFALETKLPEKRSNTSVRQEYVMGLIRKAGGYAQVVCTVQDVRQALSQIESE